MPHAELIIGRDKASEKHWYRKHPPTFSKTAAVNDAFKRSHGDIIVILDADAYVQGEVIQHCADRIRAARRRGVHLWFIPYTRLFRLSEEITNEILESEPDHPLVIADPPPPKDVDGIDGSGWGHYFGALIQIMPREAFEEVGGMDERFRGWGGEDVAFLIALDWLFGMHKNTPNSVFHLWHPQFRADTWEDSRGQSWKVRMWDGQTASHSNDWLAQKYANSRGNPEKMRKLVEEGHALAGSKWANRRAKALEFIGIYQD